ncbi:hypothetical protein [Phyllobacterium ifriqiyense]|uniref:hypothetical protein n=1 Tax=Phyllobacterium ifriqiyense TaxID=314238 RepID=UPI00339392D0
MRVPTFLFWLAVFAGVVGGLIWGLTPTRSNYPSIGGGGYDLSRPVYTLLLLGFTGLWTLTTLLISWNIKNSIASRRVLLLAMIGALATVVSIIVYHNNLT